MPRYRITISGRDKAAMLDLVDKHNIAVFDHGIRLVPDTGYTVDAFAAPDEIRKLQQNGYVVIQHEDADEAGKLRQREVARGNRYTQSTTPAPLAYLNVEEVESAILKAAAAPYSGIAELITLPEKTCEGRQCHALKIGNGGGANRTGIYFLGGVHAREWGSCDILINFIERIEQAYLDNTPLTFGGKTFSAAEIRTIVDTLDIVIFPQANPDGRQYSMSAADNSEWRKNLSPSPEQLAQCFGVDLNRNYDFLWDFSKTFSRSSRILTSTDPCNDNYFGRSAFSEPETRNARWIADRFANTRFFIDLHSYGEQILYRWGDDTDQSNDPAMNFMNPAYDGQRGVAGGYGEYMPPDDLAAILSLSEVLREGIKAVRGKDYWPMQTYQLYPTSGCSDDYFYSRHFSGPGRSKILSWTLEWGKTFQPRYTEMRNIIDDVTAGLLAFCLQIAKSVQAGGPA
jgi:murein tripeptide amidase MpaA